MIQLAKFCPRIEGQSFPNDAVFAVGPCFEITGENVKRNGSYCRIQIPIPFTRRTFDAKKFISRTGPCHYTILWVNRTALGGAKIRTVTRFWSPYGD